MNEYAILNRTFSSIESKENSTKVVGRELEEFVGIALLEDLHQQLADISQKMEREVSQKQKIRTEIESIYQLKTTGTTVEDNGTLYRDLSQEEVQMLGLGDVAIPQGDAASEFTTYRIKEEDFQVARETAIKTREGQLSQLNSNSELTMLKIQSLVDQRKNALTLLSNLLASSNDVAKTIIGNIRN